MNIYQQIINKSVQGKKQFAILIDPDKETESTLLALCSLANDSKVDYFFVGGSLLTQDCLDACITTLKENSEIPVVLFPGSVLQINHKADGILFLSLISGRNPDLLIGKHVVSAPMLKQSNLEILATGYILIDGGRPTSVSYMSNTTPIPSNKKDIAVCTAMAGEMLGLKLIFMDAGSGAENPVNEKMVAAVKKSIDIPLIIGGGIKSAEKAKAVFDAGADIVVIGNAIESNPQLIKEIAKIR
ncbi:MAG: geranylgeranylglyceryl/heptaprenylglyceryl phosphate synthase [Bacteroidetes bacterium]|nr:geranylgeranylglyceryl/heptaprenylglyceryl phosphate synthase [Bacteroidota bacterium]